MIDWLAYVAAVYFSAMYVDSRSRARPERPGRRTPVLEYRSWAFTVLIVRLVSKLLSLVAAGYLVAFPLLVVGLLVASSEHAPSLLVPFVVTPVVGIIVARLIVYDVVQATARARRREARAPSSGQGRLWRGCVSLCAVYEWACRRLVLGGGSSLRRPGQEVTVRRVMASLMAFVFGVWMLSKLVVFSGVLYALPSVYPTRVTDAVLKATGLHAALFFGVMTAVVVAAVELMQWVAERTRETPRIAAAYSAAILAAAFVSANLPLPKADRAHAIAHSAVISSIVWGIAVGLVLAVYWHVGILGFSGAIWLLSPVALSPTEWELPMVEWIEQVHTTFGEALVDFDWEGSPRVRYWFAVPPLKTSAGELSDAIAAILAAHLPRGVGLAVSMSWTRHAVVGAPGFVETNWREPNWCLHWVVDADDLGDTTDGGVPLVAALSEVFAGVTSAIADRRAQKQSGAGFPLDGVPALSDRHVPAGDTEFLFSYDTGDEVRWALWAAEPGQPHLAGLPTPDREADGLAPAG